MDIEIRENLAWDLYGISGEVIELDFAGTGKRLMDELWRRVRENQLPHKGINFWVYDSASRMFTGVEMNDATAVGDLLEYKPVNIARAAYYRYVGPYHKLVDTHHAFERELAARDLREIGPRVERYGDWVGDENQAVTEIFIGIE
ncbi:MAG: hypothetical protein ACJ73D_11235 [Pyrinomonadaceae bacterium]